MQWDSCWTLNKHITNEMRFNARNREFWLDLNGIIVNLCFFCCSHAQCYDIRVFNICLTCSNLNRHFDSLDRSQNGLFCSLRCSRWFAVRKNGILIDVCDLVIPTARPFLLCCATLFRIRQLANSLCGYWNTHNRVHSFVRLLCSLPIWFSLEMVEKCWLIEFPSWKRTQKMVNNFWATVDGFFFFGVFCALFLIYNNNDSLSFCFFFFRFANFTNKNSRHKNGHENETNVR